MITDHFNASIKILEREYKMEDKKLEWRLKSRILQYKNENNYRGLAEVYEQVGEFEKSLESAYEARWFGFALRIAEKHFPEKIDKVYEAAAKTLLNGTYYEIEEQIRPLFYNERARKIRDKLFRENIEKAEHGGKFHTAAKLCEGLDDLERAAENYMKGGFMINAAELYDRLRKFGKAAELYEHHGRDPKNTARAYERAGEKRKAAELYEGFSIDEATRLYEELGDNEARRRIWANKYAELSIGELLVELTPRALEINRIDEIKIQTARSALRSELEKIEDCTSLRNYIPTIRKREGNLINFLEDAYSDEECRARLKRVATSGTNAYTTETVFHGSGEYGETEITKHYHFDTEIGGIDMAAINLSIAYFLVKGGWEEFSFEEKQMAEQNLRNIFRRD